MNPTICDPLAGGASGSVVLNKNNELVGIY
jgi:hypothetical protein